MMYEMPVRPGAAADDPDLASKFDASEIERLSKYKVPDADMVNKIIARVYQFIQDEEEVEGEGYSGMVKEFKSDIVEAIREVAGIGSANGKYVARVIVNVLTRLGGIEIDGATQQVKVNDVDEQDLKDEIEGSVEKIISLQNNTVYEIGPESNSTPDSEADKAHELLKQEIGAGFSADGRTIITALLRHLSTSAATVLANNLLRADAIFVPVDEADEEAGPSQSDLEKGGSGDVGDEQDDSRFAAQDYFDREIGGPGLGSGSMGDY